MKETDEIITSDDLDIMLHFIMNRMKLDQWYEVRTNKAYETIKMLIQERAIDDVEFDAKQLHIRKVELNYQNTSPYAKYFARKEKRTNSKV